MKYNSDFINHNIQITSSEIEKFRKENLDLNLEIHNALSKPLDNRSVIGDGIFDYEGYLRAKIKILWILKEPYDTDGGGWHISEIYKSGEYGAARTTWYTIINVSHAILNGFKSYDNIQRMSKANKSLSFVLAHVGYMNVQKLPSKTREKSKFNVIHSAFRDPLQQDFFGRQFNLLNPDIIIGGNTLPMMFTYFGLKGKDLIRKPTDNSYIVKNKLFINAKHPSVRSNKKIYLDEIVSASKDWYTNK